MRARAISRRQALEAKARRLIAEIASVSFAVMPAAFLCVALAAAPAWAQGGVGDLAPFGGFKHDASQPIEVAADTLEVRNAQNVAIFRGDVDVKQGVVRMRADELEVTYRRGGGSAAAGDEGAIDRLRANGNVVMSNGKESAQADQADYDVEAGEIVLAGNVILLQGENAIAGERLRIDLATGTARITGGVAAASEPAGADGGDGRVRVRLNPSEAQ